MRLPAGLFWAWLILSPGAALAQGQASPAPAALVPTSAAAIAPPPQRAELDKRWVARREALLKGDKAGAQAHLDAIDKLRLDLGIDVLPTHALAIVREARKALEASQPGRAMELCSEAARLAPNHPEVQLMLARAHFAEDTFALGKYLGALGKSLGHILGEPRYGDAFYANALIDLGLALLIAALAFFALQLARHVRFLHHDLGVILGAGRVLTGILLGVVLFMPLVLGLAPVGLLLGWGVAVWVYQKRAERIVSLVLMGLVAVLPLLCYFLAPLFAFQSQIGIDLLELHGGDPTAAVVTRAESRVAREPNDLETTALLARLYKARAQDAQAEAFFKRALAIREKHGPVLNNYANFLVVTGRVTEALPFYEGAIAAGAKSATVQFNLSQAYRLLAARGSSEALAKHTAALGAAERADGAELQRLRVLAAPSRNRLVFDLSFPEPELRQRAERGMGSFEALRAQLWERVASWLPISVAPFVPLGVMALLGLAWALLRHARFASPCSRCNAIVDVVTNPELAMGDHCSQCHQIYLRGAQLDPKLRLEKEAEIHRHQTRRRSARLVLSAILMGAGQILAGRPVRGAILLLLFCWLLCEVLFWNGVVRYPLGSDPGVPFGKALLLGIIFLPAYLFGLAGVLRR